MFCLLFFQKKRILQNFESFIITIREKMNELSLDEKIKICDTQKTEAVWKNRVRKDRVHNTQVREDRVRKCQVLSTDPGKARSKNKYAHKYVA